MTGAGPGPVGWGFLVLFGLALPAAALASRRRLATVELPPRHQHFIAVILQQLVLLGLALAAARVEGVALSLKLPSAPGLVLGAATLAGLVLAFRPLWRRSVAERERLAWLFMPTTRREKVLWAGVAAAAGVGEEIAYRGVFTELALRLTGMPAAAIGLAVLAFALAHSTQKLRTTLLILPVALVFHGLVMATGTLVIAIAVHAAYDLIAGLTYARLGRELGYAQTPS